jgi:hypothetical protein
VSALRVRCIQRGMCRQEPCSLTSPLAIQLRWLLWQVLLVTVGLLRRSCVMASECECASWLMATPLELLLSQLRTATSRNRSRATVLDMMLYQAL